MSKVSMSEIKKEENSIKLELKKTDLKKIAFIEEIKNGLGEKIKLNPNSLVKVIKPKENFFNRVLKRLKNMF
jgi:hypothetical protein